MSVKLGVYTVLIRQDKMLNTPKEIWGWDLPVLESKYPGGLVQIVKAGIVERDKKPEARVEAQRLSSQYVPDDPNFTHFDLTYGRGKAGLDALKKAITACTNPKEWVVPDQVEMSEEEILTQIDELKAKLKKGKKAA